MYRTRFARTGTVTNALSPAKSSEQCETQWLMTCESKTEKTRLDGQRRKWAATPQPTMMDGNPQGKVHEDL
jgi:hypothetical protein